MDLMTTVLSQINAVDPSLSLAEYCFNHNGTESANFILKLMDSGKLDLTPQTSLGELVELIGDGKAVMQIAGGPIVRAPITTLEKIKMALVLMAGFFVIFGGGGIVLLMYIRGEVDNGLVRDWFGLLMELIKIFGSNSITDVV